jgi:DNA-directed RNA polymerase specialized sigma24 family protein
MSPTAPARRSQNQRDGDPIFFWIRPVDESGKSVDEALIRVAYEKAGDFLRYRAAELRDEAIRADLVETAVYAVSNTGRTEGFRDVRGYLFAVFKRLVDQRIARDRRENTQLPADRDGGPRIVSREPEIEGQVYNRELLDVMREVMDEKTIWAWERRMLGYRLEEIAAELNVSADTLSTRLRRGRDAARKRLADRKR